ncbi:emp24/gp25L/p24 family/GOLD-domain-containing protein [Pelagophyceae sp. CCMP2097]|nr:emp24/gp25L/p24 family/GOLD-domain-containing protein [Pelagophyceae sp. CCMP2097]|mmetsp:Transcript_9456/g.31260  ORF Transcript_9456/g.31260 Transcript_9456/m.31260 type:complete len:253 (-) Transcript_9456:233-991(-)
MLRSGAVAAWLLGLRCCLGEQTISTTETNFVTFKVKNKEERCFYEVLEASARATFELFVLSGGDLNVKFTVDGPLYIGDDGELDEERALTVYAGVIKSDDKLGFATPTQVTAIASVSALYRACVENAGSSFGGDKVVQLGVRQTRAVDTDDEVPAQQAAKGAADAADVAALSKRVSDLRAALLSLRGKQSRERRRLAHHRALNDANHARMASSSALETVAYVVSSAFQLVFVRRWFEGKSIAINVFGGESNV